ncbi:hypothetical protein FB45DRAFT_1125274, partial [Roridomyces roridus]
TWTEECEREENKVIVAWVQRAHHDPVGNHHLFSSPIVSGHQLRARLAQIELQIDALGAQMAALRTERDAVTRDLQSVVYPVLSLPNEIMGEIFTQYVDTERNPMLLTWVCRSWREVALSTSRLWTCSWVNLPVKMVALWLSRSGSLPLDVDVEFKDPQSSEELCKILSGYWARLEAFSVQTKMREELLHLPRAFSRLRKLQIYSPHVVLQSFDAPQLREVVLHSHSLKEWRNILPCVQLTKVELLVCNIEEYLVLLSQTINLEELTILDELYHHNTPIRIGTTSVPVQLPRLHTVSLWPEESCRLFQYMTLPALADVTITVTMNWDWNMFADLVSESKCLLQKLSLSLDGVAGDTMLKFLDVVREELTSVRELTLICPSNQTNAFERLFGTIAKDLTLMPALESFNITECQFHVPFPPLVRMLAARTQHDKEGVAKLKSFQLTFDPENGREDGEMRDEDVDSKILGALEDLRGLLSQGLQVSIQSECERLGSNIDPRLIRAHSYGEFTYSLSRKIEDIGRL